MVIRKDNSMRIIEHIGRLILYTTDYQTKVFENAVLIDTDDSILVIVGTSCYTYDVSDIASYEVTY